MREDLFYGDSSGRIRWNHCRKRVNDMKAAIHQPYFIPYIGYWQLIDSVDLFAIADNYNYIKQGWINRNRILEGDNIRYFNITVDHASQNRYICDHLIKPVDREKKITQLRNFYHHAPYREEGIRLMESMLSFEGNNLADFLYHSIRQVCDYLEIETEIVRTSDYIQDPELKFAHRIYDYCRQMGADTYHNLIGGKSLYTFEEFQDQGLNLAFIEPVPIPYPQSSASFIADLSILDVIMQNSVPEIREMLGSYKLITPTDK